MDILEELENAIGHSITSSNLLHMDRDFTEYGILLIEFRHYLTMILQYMKLDSSTISGAEMITNCC
jgi:hypothetical protein